MGRPKSDDPKRNRMELRLTDAELREIEYMAKALGISKSEAVLDAVTYRYLEIYNFRQKRYGDGDPILTETKKRSKM